MKNSIFTKYTWILALCAVAFTSSLYVACTKDIANEQAQPAVNATGKTTEVDKAPTPKEQAEIMGRTAYNHLKFYSVQKKAEDYVNPAIRQSIMENLAKTQEAYKGLSFEQSLQKALDEKMMTPKMAQSMRDLNAVAVAASNDATIEALETRFKAFEEMVYADKGLTDTEKMLVSSTSTSFRSLMRFTDEMEKGTVSSDRATGNVRLRSTCVFGRKLECFASAFFKASLGAVVTGVITGGAGTAVGFLAGIVVNIINIYVDNSCACDNPSGGGCFDIKFLNPVISSTAPCDPAVAFVVSGTGSLPTQFNWTASFIDAQGFERVIQDVSNKPTLGPALLPFIVPNPDVDIKLTVIPLNCPGKEFHFTLKSLLGDPGDVIVSGDYTNYLNATKTFNMNGSCLVNPFNQYTWNNPSVGNIVSGGNTSSVQIKFTMKTCGNYGCFPAYIIGNSKNPCFTQQSSSGSWKVEVR